MPRFTTIVLFSTLALQSLPLMAAPGAATASLKGTARTPAGQALPHVGVQARDLQTGRIVGSSTTDASGAFAFRGLSPASYVVEAVNPAGAIVGSSAATAVAAGGNATTAVATSTATADAAVAAAAFGASSAAARSRAMVVTSAAASAGIRGAVVTAHDASPVR